MLNSSPPTQEKTDPRVKRTRNLILRAFEELLNEKGFAEITIQDIAERAEINRATFYAHFPDKYALLQFSTEQTFRQELEKRTLSACHYSPQNLRALILTVCEFVAGSNRYCKMRDTHFDSLVESKVREQVRILLEWWLREKEKSESERIAIATAWAIYGLAQHWSRLKPRPTAEEYAEQVAPLVSCMLPL